MHERVMATESVDADDDSVVPRVGIDGAPDTNIDPGDLTPAPDRTGLQHQGGTGITPGYLPRQHRTLVPEFKACKAQNCQTPARPDQNRKPDHPVHRKLARFPLIQNKKNKHQNPGLTGEKDQGIPRKPVAPSTRTRRNTKPDASAKPGTDRIQPLLPVDGRDWTQTRQLRLSDLYPALVCTPASEDIRVSLNAVISSSAP